nr:MAG TPA: hypothetical protein [Caudoviricetes sp.]
MCTHSSEYCKQLYAIRNIIVKLKYLTLYHFHGIMVL